MRELQVTTAQGAETGLEESVVEAFHGSLRGEFLRSGDEGYDEAIDIMVERYMSVPAPFSHIVVEHMGGAVSRMDPQATAYNYRDAQYNFLIVGIWPEAAEDERNIQWIRGLWQALQPFSTGNIYVNYESDVGVDRVKAAYGSAKYERLVALKNTYDPTNVFRLNQNIKPTV